MKDKMGDPGELAGRHLGHLGGIWRYLGASGGIWRHLGGIWRHLGGIWEASGGNWEATGRHLETSGGIWRQLGGNWEASGGIWRHLGGIWEAPGGQRHLGTKIVDFCCYLRWSISEIAIIAERGEGANANSSIFARANVKKYDFS